MGKAYNVIWKVRIKTDVKRENTELRVVDQIAATERGELKVKVGKRRVGDGMGS